MVNSRKYSVWMYPNNPQVKTRAKINCRGEYWTCGQELDPRNCNWKSWQHLKRLCRKRGLDDFALRDFLVEHLKRKLDGK